MSSIVLVPTTKVVDGEKIAVTDSALLGKACNRLRREGLAVVGPRYEANYPRRYSGKREAHLVTMPTWYGPCAFFCDEAGEAQQDSDDVYDAPKKEMFNRLLGAYGDEVRIEKNIAAITGYASQAGGYVSQQQFDETTGLTTISLEIPEVLSATH